MVYDWEQHKDVCYRLYIQERKSLEEIMQHMRDTFSFTPSKRAFQTQFRRWDFPSKQNPAHRNVDLVSRIKELWEQNYSQRDMLKTLNDEGHEIKERELMRVRAKHRWLLRIANGAKPVPVDESEDLFQAQLLDAAAAAAPDESIPHEILRKRKERHDRLQAESDERWAAKKRRRRTRDYAGIAADPPGPPRFPSETTLAESMEFLSLTKKQYREVRDHFQRICEDEGIIKKTLAGPDKWAATKTRLMNENDYVRQAFDGTNQQSKELALDVICTDVTKRMRTTERRMTISDSKNALGMDPEQSRQVRNAFYLILHHNHFVSKLETGQEHWQALKTQWMNTTPLLQEILAGGEADPDYEKKMKAMEVLCRDVMKRLRDDLKRKDGPKEDDTLSASSPAASASVSTAIPQQTMSQQIGQLNTAPLPSTTFNASDFQIDPTLLQATAFTMPLSIPVTPTPIYIRPHPLSSMHASDKLWLTSLTSRTMTELYTIVSQKWPSTSITRIHGVEKGSDGQEIPYLIEEDEELDAYLDHVQNRKAVFVVLLERR